jgi:predicted ribosome quality control (RQC) complex YloA/Tae2 family protein
MEKLKIQGDAQHYKAPEFNFKHYIIDNKYNLYVGKDSKNNDLLTVKFAKQNDYWFHARGVPGSHAVLRTDNSKEAIPKSVLKKAASVAAFHSKAKTSKLAPVSFTFKKYVVKRKGMDAGQVAMLKEDVIMAVPEIPQGCEYQE